MKNVIAITVLMILLSLSFLQAQIRIPNKNPKIPTNSIPSNIGNNKQIKDSYGFGDGEFYYHQLAGNQVVGLYEAPGISFVFEGEIKKQSNGKYLINNKYNAVPKQKNQRQDHVDYIPGTFKLNEDLVTGEFTFTEERTLQRVRLSSPARRTKRPTIESAFYGPLGASLTGAWLGGNNYHSNYINMVPSTKSIYWMGESQRPGQEYCFVFIGKYREIPGPPDEFGYRPDKYYRITGSYYSLNKYGRAEKYFGQVTYEGDWYNLKQTKITEGTGKGKDILPKRLYKERMGYVSIRKIEALSEDACSPMNFFGSMYSNSGRTRLEQTDANTITFDRRNKYIHKFRWYANKSTDFEVALMLNDKDESALCGGGDDRVDINPTVGEHNHSINLEINVDGTIYAKINRRKTRLGKIGEEITIQGDCNDSNMECAKITFIVNYDEL